MPRPPIASRCFLACLLAAGALGAAEDPKADPAFQKRVRTSIDKGVAWLLSKQSTTGKFPGFEDTRGEVYPLGMHALSTLAVIKGGQPVDSPEVTKALRALASLYQTNRNNLRTYEVGVTLMALDARYHTEPKGKRRRRRRKPKVAPADLKLAQDLVLWLQTKQRPSGMWRYPEGGVDLSNTQYAALGLWSGHRLGVEVNRGVVRRMLEDVLARQAKTGPSVPFLPDYDPHAKGGERRSSSVITARGWRYLKEEIKTVNGKEVKVPYPYSGSMTSAGVAILAIGRHLLGEKDSWLTKARDREIRTSMWQGLAWLQANWDLHDNPGQPGNWPFYWIYGLERCARLSGVEYIGKHDWYHEGAVRLVDDQKPDGSWPKTQRMRPPGDQNVRWWSDQVDTCFAILFLTQSTPLLKTPPPTITTRER